MPLDLFETLENAKDSVSITNLRDEIGWDTTQSCAETGCGGPGDPW